MSNHPGPFTTRHITLNPSPSPETVEAFYDCALRAALGGLMGCPSVSSSAAAISGAFLAARLATERRFGVKLVPGDGD